LVGTLSRNLDQDKKLKDALGDTFRDALKAAAEERDAPEKFAKAVKWAQDALH